MDATESEAEKIEDPCYWVIMHGRFLYYITALPPYSPLKFTQFQSRARLFSAKEEIPHEVIKNELAKVFNPALTWTICKIPVTEGNSVMSNRMCYWTVVNKDPELTDVDQQLLYVTDNDGKMSFTNDIALATTLPVSLPYDRKAIEEALRDRGWGATVFPAGRMDVSTGEEIPDTDHDVGEKPEQAPVLTVVIKGRQDAVVFLGRMIAQNHVVLLGSEEKEIESSGVVKNEDGTYENIISLYIKE